MERKKYFDARRAKFKRKFVSEKKKVHKAISILKNKSIPKKSYINDESQFEIVDNKSAVHTSLLHNELREWALKYNIRTYSLRDLLKILNDNCVSFLPRDPATFLRTPKIVETENIANGQFWYSGIANKLHKIFQTADKSLKIELNVHVDGVQLFNSSSKQFWPILGQINGR